MTGSSAPTTGSSTPRSTPSTSRSASTPPSGVALLRHRSVAERVAIATAAKRKPGRPRNTSSEDTKLRILEAAVDCFADGGFDGTASLTIADRAGVTPATIYHHFSNKRTLYIAAFQHSIDVAWRQYTEVADAGYASVVD